jgi:hypothetical protein
MEWRATDPQSGTQQLALAIVAFDRKTHALQELAQIMGKDEGLIRSHLSTLTFIDMNNKNSEISYVSDQFRNFAARKLEYVKQLAHELIISFLENSPGSQDSLIFLPDHLQEVGRLQDLLAYLSPLNMLNLAERANSLTLVRQKADLGYKTAKILQRHDEILRFALTRSIAAEMGDADIWKSEIEALVALNDYEGAFALVQATAVKERRLDLLCVLARIQKAKGQEIDESVMIQVEQLLAQIDVSKLGQKALEIASNLFFLSPELAVNIVEGAFRSNNSGNAMDWAFATLFVTIEPRLRGSKEFFGLSKDREQLAEKIKSPAVRRMRNALALSFNEYSAPEILLEYKKLARASEQVAVLRHWIIENPRDEGVGDVLEAALAIASPKKGVGDIALYEDFSLSLTNITDISKLARLVASFDGCLSNFSSSDEPGLASIQIRLAEAESRLDPKHSVSRFLDTYIIFKEISDKKKRLSLLGQMVGCGSIIDPEKELEELGIHSDLLRSLWDMINEGLDQSSDHFDYLEGALRGLAVRETKMAISITKNMNTEDRRNSAFMLIAEEHLSRRNLNLIVLDELRREVTNPDNVDNLVANVWYVLSRQQELLSCAAEELMVWVDAIELICDLEGVSKVPA